MKSTRLAALLACAIAVPGAQASLLSDFEAGDVVTDFLFDDAAGTTIPLAANSGSVGGSFDDDTDSADVVTTGLGQLDASPKANTSFGSNYVDLPTYDSGRVLGLLDVTWAFDEGVYDPSQDEEFRLTLIANDPRSTFVTAEIFFQRTSATEVTLFGNGTGTGASDTDDVVFGSSGSLLTIIDLDVQSREFELFYSDDAGATFLSAGTGITGDFDNSTPEIEVRPVSSVRLVLNEDFSDDRVLVERFAVSVIPEPTALVLATMALAVASRRRG